jgi:F0F1-type ATP synthase assembly protein I
MLFYSNPVVLLIGALLLLVTSILVTTPQRLMVVLMAGFALSVLVVLRAVREPGPYRLYRRLLLAMWTLGP